MCRKSGIVRLSLTLTKLAAVYYLYCGLRLYTGLLVHLFTSELSFLAIRLTQKVLLKQKKSAVNNYVHVSNCGRSIFTAFETSPMTGVAKSRCKGLELPQKTVIRRNDPWHSDSAQPLLQNSRHFGSHLVFGELKEEAFSAAEIASI